MKTKTIDDIIEIITLVRKSDLSGIDSELLIKCNKLLLGEKQRKEQKKKTMGWFSTKPMEFVPILPDLTKDLERLSKAIDEYNEAIKKQVTQTGRTIETFTPISFVSNSCIVNEEIRLKYNEAIKENKQLKEENEGLKQDLKHFKDKSDVFARNIKDLISNQEINPMDVNKLYIKDYLFMHDERLFSGCVEYEKGKPIHISKRLLHL